MRSIHVADAVGQSALPSRRFRLIISNPDIPKDPRVAATGPAAKVTAAVCKLIAKHFDEGRGLYQLDWDDLRVAAESGAHLVFVVLLRRHNYGELMVPTAAE
jgi:hypothetical protein